MQLVNRYLIYFIVLFSLLISGCATKNINKDKDFVQKVYKGISKDAILEATKKAFIFSGNAVFFIDSYRNNVYVTRTKMVHYPLYAKTFEDRWNLSVEEKDNISYVKLSAKRVHDHDEKDITYFHHDTHKLLLSRMEYFLGLNNQWLSCAFYHKYTSFDEALCDAVDLKTLREPNKYDIINNIYIEDRKKDVSINSKKNDILGEDIVLTLDDEKVDILDKEIIDEEESSDKKLDELDKEILELDKKVTDNINETLENIENNSEN